MGSVKIYGQKGTVDAASILPQEKSHSVKSLHKFISKGTTDSKFLNNHSVAKTFVRIGAVVTYPVTGLVAKISDAASSTDQFAKARDKMTNLFAEKVLPEAAAKTKFNDQKTAHDQIKEAKVADKIAHQAEKEFAQVVGDKFAQIKNPKGFFRVADAAIESVRNSEAFKGIVDKGQKTALLANVKDVLGKEILKHVAKTLTDKDKRADLGDIGQILARAVDKGYAETKAVALLTILKTLKKNLSKDDYKAIQKTLKKEINHVNRTKIKEAREKQRKEVRKHRSLSKEIKKLETKEKKAIQRRQPKVGEVSQQIDKIAGKLNLDGVDKLRKRSSLEDVKEVVADLKDQISEKIKGTKSKKKQRNLERTEKKLMKELNRRIRKLENVDKKYGYEKVQARREKKEEALAEVSDTAQSRKELKKGFKKDAKNNAAVVEGSRKYKTKIGRDGKKLSGVSEKVNKDTQTKLLRMAKDAINSSESEEESDTDEASASSSSDTSHKTSKKSKKDASSSSESDASASSSSDTSHKTSKKGTSKEVNVINKKIRKLEKQKSEVSKNYVEAQKLLKSQASIQADLDKIADLSDGETSYVPKKAKHQKEVTGLVKDLGKVNQKIADLGDEDATALQKDLKKQFAKLEKKIADLKSEKRLALGGKKEKSDSSGSDTDSSASSRSSGSSSSAGSSTEESDSDSDSSASGSSGKSGGSSSSAGSSTEESDSVSGSSSSSGTEKTKKKKKAGKTKKSEKNAKATKKAKAAKKAKAEKAKAKKAAAAKKAKAKKKSK